MSGIRFKPKYTVLPQSPSVKKGCFTFHRGRNTLLFCTRNIVIPPNNIKRIFDGGSPSITNQRVLDGGTPPSGGPKLYDGGTP
jgi:hypothetical protein